MNNYEINEWFYEKIKPHEYSLRAWLRGRFALESGVDDVIQESYLRVIRARKKRELHSPKAYLFTTARNVTYDLIRKVRTYPMESLDADEVSELADDSCQVDDMVSRNEEIEILKEAISKLPNRCRQIMTLRKVYGLSYREISSQLGISERTISAQMNIGLRKCSKYVEKRTRMAR